MHAKQSRVPVQPSFMDRQSHDYFNRSSGSAKRAFGKNPLALL